MGSEMCIRDRSLGNPGRRYCFGRGSNCGWKNQPGLAVTGRAYRLSAGTGGAPARLFSQGRTLTPRHHHQSRIVNTSVKRSSRFSNASLAVLALLVIVLITAPWWAGRAELRLLGEVYLYLSLACLWNLICLLYTSPSPRDATLSRMPSSA